MVIMILMPTIASESLSCDWQWKCEKNIWGNHKYLKGFKIKLENEIKMKLSRRIFLCLKKGKTKWKTATKTRCKKQTNFCMTCDRINKQKEVNWSNIPKNCCKDKAPLKTLAQQSIQSNRHFDLCILSKVAF